MAVTVVQSIAQLGNPPATFSAGVTAGNTVFLVLAGYTTASGNPSVSGVKLGGSTVSGTVAFFNPGTTGGILSPLSGSNGAFISIWMIPNVPGGGTTVDYTGSNFSGIIGQCIYEVSGLGTTPSLDQSSSGGAASGTAVNSGTTGAITSATEIVFGGTMAFSGTPATNSGWTCLQPGGGTDLCAGYQIPVSSGGTYNWSQTSSGSPWAAFVATVKGTPAAPVVAPFHPVTMSRARLPGPFRKGRQASNAGAPVRNPGVVPVYGAIGGAVRASLPVNLRGRTSSGPGTPAANPASGPAFRQKTGPARPVLPPLQPRAGRVASNPGGPVRNPASGPVFRPAPRPAQARVPLPPRGRTWSNPGGPVVNPAPPGLGPQFFPAVQAIRIRPPLPPRGRVAGGRGAPARNPVQGAAFPAARGPAQARFPLPPRGRTGSNPGIPVVVIPPATGPVFTPRRDPARIRPSLPPRGRVSANPGAPVRNPRPGPVFRQAVRPVRAVIPQNAPRGRTSGNPGGPVANKRFTRILITAGDLFTLWDTGDFITAWDTGDLIVSE